MVWLRGEMLSIVETSATHKVQEERKIRTNRSALLRRPRILGSFKDESRSTSEPSSDRRDETSTVQRHSACFYNYGRDGLKCQSRSRVEISSNSKRLAFAQSVDWYARKELISGRRSEVSKDQQLKCRHGLKPKCHSSSTHLGSAKPHDSNLLSLTKSIHTLIPLSDNGEKTTSVQHILRSLCQRSHAAHR